MMELESEDDWDLLYHKRGISVERTEVALYMDRLRRRWLRGERWTDRWKRLGKMPESYELTNSHFEQASPHCLPVGGSVDLSDLQVKRE
jgi:hypothetical protein